MTSSPHDDGVSAPGPAVAAGPRRRAPLPFRAAASIVRPAMNGLMGKEWRGLETLPASGYIAVANHVSEADPVAVAHAVYRAGHTPHFLAKDSLFTMPLLGAVMRGLRQVPVARADRRESQKSLVAAREVLAERGCIIIYPEGTLTRDPELWPMRCKTGAARLALATGAPLIPITHWGVQDFLAPYGKAPRLMPRPRYTLSVGAEIGLEDLRGKPLTRRVLAEATERIESALTEGVAALRGEDPPAEIWDRAARCRVPRRSSDAGGTGPDRPAAGPSPADQQPADQELADQPRDGTAAEGENQ